MARDTTPSAVPLPRWSSALKMGPSWVYNDGVLDGGRLMRALFPASLAPVKPSSSPGSRSLSLKGRGCARWPQDAFPALASQVPLLPAGQKNGLSQRCDFLLSDSCHVS